MAKQSDGKGEQTAPDTHAWPIRRPAVLTCSWCLCAQPVHCTPCRLRRMLRPDDQARAWRRSQGRTHRPARHSTVRSLRGACAAFDQGERQCRPDESERRRRGGYMFDMLAAATGTPVALRSHWRPTRRDWTSPGCCAWRPAPAVDEAKKVAVVVVAMEVRAEAARSLAAAAAMRRMQRMQR